MQEHVKIYTGDGILARRLQMLLDDAGIPSLKKDFQESGRLAGFGVLGNSVELFVYDKDVKKTLEIVADFNKFIEKQKD